ncbi:MAG: hypothetical protein M1830_001429 [Pleopsidium flavum]|nr:MAG: hypothetical protein M1830_001429 [Pleopsidium flavum]
MSMTVDDSSRSLCSDLNDLGINIDASGVDKYPAKQHAQAVAHRLDVSEGLIYLPGQRTVFLEDSDQPRLFRQRRYFYYLSGVDEPNCYLTYDIRKDTLILYIPPTDPQQVIWFGKGSTIKEAEGRYDVDEVRGNDTLQADLEHWIESNKNTTVYNTTVYILHVDQKPTNTDPCHLECSQLLVAMNSARVTKDPHEIRLIRRANSISAYAHRSVLQAIRQFKNEAQIEATFIDACISKGTKHQAYDIIAASGENNSTLHYVKNNEPLKGRQLVCLDAGCEWECYASDVTRTFPISGYWPSREAKDIYDIVQLMQISCIKKLKPGVRFLSLHILAHKIAIEGLLRLGILEGGTPEDIYQSGTSQAFFPHGLGHHLGLEYFRRNSPCTADSSELEEGMVITVEPGIYFSRYGLDHIYLHNPNFLRFVNISVLKRYLPIGGIRIEDDILITADGYENLTTAPKGEEMLRIIRNGADASKLDPQAS